MSHGRIISLDTPQQIKKQYGVGYNVSCEAKHQFENQLDAESLHNAFDSVRSIFFANEDLQGVEESSDSTDRKLIIQFPLAHIQLLADLIQQVEIRVPQLQIDIELNSLEDAFIKIAEGDIHKEQQLIKEDAQKHLFMSADDEERALEDYFKYEGVQSMCRKILVVTQHRLLLFYRNTTEWALILSPILFVIMLSFILYSFIKVGVRAAEERAEQKRVVGVSEEDIRVLEMDKTVQLMLKISFGFLLSLGSTFTAGKSAILPMEERKVGLRHMMHLFGLNSFEYFFGLGLADLLINLAPALLCSIILLAFDEVMERKYVPEFLLLFWVFGESLTVFSYAFSHVFGNPETGIRYISMVFIFGLLIGPLVVLNIAVAATDNSQQGLLGYSILYCFSPLYTFFMATYNISVRDSDVLDPWKVFDEVPSTQVSCGVMALQIFFVFSVVVLVDYCLRNSYKRQGGSHGDPPPQLEVHFDVMEHE